MGLLTLWGFGPLGGSFGDGSDGVGYFTSNTDLTVDANGLCVRQYRSLYVAPGVTVKPAAACKCFLIFVNGLCDIRGTVTMTGLGYPTASDSGAGKGLWLSTDTPAACSGLTNVLADYVTKIVPDDYYIIGGAAGATGAVRTDGAAGNAADHSPGGGGGGGQGIESNNPAASAGDGGTASPFGGGGGSGGTMGTNSSPDAVGTDGGNGGPDVSNYGHESGGAGNAAGLGINGGHDGAFGVGGNLWILAKEFDLGSAGILSANGKDGGTTTGLPYYSSGGGGSGAGTIHVMSLSLTVEGTVQANGGAGGLKMNATYDHNGGAGGAGYIQQIDLTAYIYRLTEDGDFRVTEDGDFRITQ